MLLPYSKAQHSLRNILMYTAMKTSKSKKLQLMNAKGKSFAAFSLVEVTIAVGLMAFCLVAMLGVMPVGLMQERGSADKIAAMQVLTAVESDFQNSSGTGLTTRYKIDPEVGGEGSFYVDHAFQHTEQQANAEFNVWYRIVGEPGNQAGKRMHLFVGRVRPDGLAQLNVVVEGIAQKRLN